MLSPIILLVLGRVGHGFPQEEEPNLITDGNFEKPLPLEWNSSNVQVTFGDSKKRKGKFIRLDRNGPKNAGDEMLQVKTAGVVHLGDTLYFRAFVRNANSGQNACGLQIDLRPGESPAKFLIDRNVSPTHQWKEYKFAAATNDFYLPGALTLTFRLTPGSSVELSNLRLLDMGDTPVSSLPQTLRPFRASESKRSLSGDGLKGDQ